MNQTADGAAAVIAGRQLSMITTAQLTLVGLRSRAISGRVGRGVLLRVFRGVYRWGAGPAAPGAVDSPAAWRAVRARW